MNWFAAAQAAQKLKFRREYPDALFAAAQAAQKHGTLLYR
ncbi:hypothetical protein CZ787_10690 [Halomonas citrativorans]|uniref:Uncharacterized protein n=1 Tax=Halomonas citrativorans TaxID=2742612 RepID=A0A1R4I1E4_9GAMM|nr:hypothetical protein CZ787_10690 [Halomonas citrativorans]